MLATHLRPLALPKLTPSTSTLPHVLAITDRAHTGRHTQGRIPVDMVYGAREMKAAR